MSTRLAVRLLADVDWMHEPPPQSLIEGLGLTAGALAVIYSAPGAGKTFVTLSIASALALAPDWLGHRISCPRPVVYAVGEGQAAFPLRLQALRAAAGLQETEPSGVLYMREPFNLMDADDVTAVLDAIREQLAPTGDTLGMFVADPLAAFMPGGDESNTKDMSTVVAALNRIRATTGACVLVDHHTGWNPDRERGSIALRAAADVMYSLKQDDGILTLACDKLRDGVMPPPLQLRLRSTAGACVVEQADPAAATELGTQLTARQQHVLDTLRLIVVDEPVAYTRWKEASGAADSTFDRSAALLVKAGYVMKIGKGKPRYTIPGQLPPTPTSPPPNPHGGGRSYFYQPPGPYKGPGWG